MNGPLVPIPPPRTNQPDLDDVRIEPRTGYPQDRVFRTYYREWEDDDYELFRELYDSFEETPF